MQSEAEPPSSPQVDSVDDADPVLLIRPTEKETVVALKALHDNGLLADENGINDHIAAHLIAPPAMPGDTSGSGTPEKGLKLPTLPADAAPSTSPNAPEHAVPTGATMDSVAELLRVTSVSAHSDSSLKSLLQSLRSLVVSTASVEDGLRATLQEKLVALFVQIAQERFVEMFMRSLPRGTSGSASIASILKAQSLKASRRGDQRSGDSSGFQLHIASDVMHEIGLDVLRVLDSSLRRSSSAAAASLTGVVSSFANVSQFVSAYTDDLGHTRAQLASMETLYGKAMEMKKQYEEQITELHGTIAAQEAEIGILRATVARRNDDLDEKRDAFTREVLRYRTLLYEAQKDANMTPTDGFSLGNRSGSLSKSEEVAQSVADALGPSTHLLLDARTAEKVEAERNRVKEDFMQQIRNLKAAHARELQRVRAEHQTLKMTREHELAQLQVNKASKERALSSATETAKQQKTGVSPALPELVHS